MIVAPSGSQDITARRVGLVGAEWREALHRPGDSLDEPALRRGEPGLGRAAQGCRGRIGADGREASRAARPRRLAPAACGRAALHPLGLQGVRHRLPRRRSGPRGGDRARRVPPGARRHARLGGRQHAAAGARRAAVAGGGTRRARYCRISRRRDRTPGPALVAARPAARAVRRSRPRAHRGADRPHLPRPGRRGHCRPRALGHRLPGGLAGLARQRADRRLPPRLPPAGRAGADLPHRGHRRRGGGREGVPEECTRHPAGWHRPRQIPAGSAREGARLAGGDRADQGWRAAGPGLLRSRRLRPARRPRRGRAGGARDLSRPGLAGERRALHAAAVLAGVPADGLGRRPRRRP